jgi:hypothetical protein
MGDAGQEENGRAREPVPNWESLGPGCPAVAMSAKSPGPSQRTREGQGTRFCVVKSLGHPADSQLHEDRSHREEVGLKCIHVGTHKNSITVLGFYLHDLSVLQPSLATQGCNLRVGQEIPTT